MPLRDPAWPGKHQTQLVQEFTDAGGYGLALEEMAGAPEHARTPITDHRQIAETVTAQAPANTTAAGPAASANTSPTAAQCAAAGSFEPTLWKRRVHVLRPGTG